MSNLPRTFCQFSTSRKPFYVKYMLPYHLQFLPIYTNFTTKSVLSRVTHFCMEKNLPNKLASSKMRKLKADKLTSWQTHRHDMMTIWLIEKLPGWKDDKLTIWLIDRMTRWLDNKQEDMIVDKGVWWLVLETFKNSSAERVPSEWSQARYIADIFQKDIFIAGSDILPIYLRCRTVLL